MTCRRAYIHTNRISSECVIAIICGEKTFRCCKTVSYFFFLRKPPNQIPRRKSSHVLDHGLLIPGSNYDLEDFSKTCIARTMTVKIIVDRLVIADELHMHSSGPMIPRDRWGRRRMILASNKKKAGKQQQTVFCHIFMCSHQNSNLDVLTNRGF